MFATVDLYQFAVALTSQSRLVKDSSLPAGQLQAGFGHPLAQCLTRDFDTVPFEKCLGS